jgi:hypothetical protein
VKALKTVAAVVPGPAVVFVGRWLTLFSATRLVYPEWQQSADAISLGVGAFVAVFLSISMARVRKTLLRRWCWAGFALTLLLLAGCWAVRLHLGPTRPGETAPDPVFWQDVWQTLYILAMILLIATITLGALTLKEDRPGWFWVIVIGALIAILAVAAFIWWV